MRVLIAEDDDVSRRVLQANLEKWGYEVTAASDGNQALIRLTGEQAPHLAILDWMMPGKDGLEICKELQKHDIDSILYIIMLTAKGRKEDIVRALDAGADDYIIKPFDKSELKARVSVGVRLVNLELALRNKISELEEALDNVRQLQGIIPICAWCKRVRDDDQYWHDVEKYLANHSQVEFSHSICPECREKQFGDIPAGRKYR
jgi:sigma-B regulation protein RsbU (phosphoserine phosphatase)